MKPKTAKRIYNISFIIMILSILGIVTAARYSYVTDPDPIIEICVAIGLISLITHVWLRRVKTDWQDADSDKS